MRPFEVWLWRTADAVGRAIRAQEWAEVSHVELRFPDRGARLDVGPRKGVRFTTETRELQKGEKVYVYRFNAPAHRVRTMAVRCGVMSGRKYDILGIFRFIVPLCQALRVLGLRNNTSQRRICSSAVEEVLRTAGYGFVSNDVPVERISPGDLFGSIRKLEADEAFTMERDRQGRISFNTLWRP